MPDNGTIKLTRKRPRIRSFEIDKQVIADRIKNFYDNDNTDRAWDIDARLQRYAKFRMWTEPKDWPYPGCTNVALPDMMTASMRMQDTLSNAVLSQRPPIMAKATHKSNREKEEKINHLIDFQIFEEQPGEQTIGALIDDFVNDGLLTAYIPWIKEARTVRELKIYDPVPDEILPVDYFAGILQGHFPKGALEPSADGWDWKIEVDDKRYRASFFSRANGEIELDLEYEAEVFNGPRVIRKDVQDVLHPARCENLQIPGPSNPTGASHVILRDFPSVDELTRLYHDKFYDLMTDDDAKKLGVTVMDTAHQQREEQKDVLQGHAGQSEPPKGAESHKTLTRLMVFDCFDINGDGLDEDVIWWMILETKTLLRVRYLSEMFPSNPPRRPFAEAGLFPVPGRRFAIGMLEMMEGVHDLMKQFFDQGGDAGTIANAPFGFYRQASNMRPEVVRLWPGEMYPLTDPQRDVSFPQLGNKDQSFMFNMISLLTQVEERLTTIGDLQVGRVPQGKASALRTVAGMQTILSQGDARPERVLRRFFSGLAQIWQQVHILNETFLPRDKQFMICGFVEPGKDPYAKVGSPAEIQGKFRFTFSANVLNTSKEALQASLQDLLGIYVSELAIQLGVIDGPGVYRLLRDIGRAKGQDPDKYIKPPSPGAEDPGIFAEEAMSILADGGIPEGLPMEGAGQHLQKMIELVDKFINDVGSQAGDPQSQAGMMQIMSNANAYMNGLRKLVLQEQKQTALLAAARNFGAGAQPGELPGPPGQAQPNAQAMPMLGPNELADETLPGAGGGGSPRML